jgi:hemoglobin/transferrin/lactoferrin receptor protein
MNISKPMAMTLSLLMNFLLGFALAVTVAAQAPNANISGTVKDSAGAAIDGAEVTLVRMQSVLRTTVTGSNGKFTMDNVAPGSYAVIVRRADFGRFSVAVQVTAGERKDLDVMLEVNPLSEQVTVTAEAGSVSDAKTLAQPVNVINEQEILDRATEVVAQVVNEEQGVNLQRTSPSLSAVFVRGLTGRNVAVYVDGVRYTTSAQRGGVGTFFSLIEPSSLETVEILRGPNSSQYGSDAHGGGKSQTEVCATLVSRSGAKLD